MTHECMNVDGAMETVGRRQLWGIYFDDDRSPTLRARDRGYNSRAIAEEFLREIEKTPQSREYRVVAICQPFLGDNSWKICGGREAVLPSKRESAGGFVQFGKPPAGGES